MREENKEWILNNTDNGIITSKAVTEHGIHRSVLSEMVKSGELIQCSRGIKKMQEDNMKKIWNVTRSEYICWLMSGKMSFISCSKNTNAAYSHTPPRCIFWVIRNVCRLCSI